MTKVIMMASQDPGNKLHIFSLPAAVCFAFAMLFFCFVFLFVLFFVKSDLEIFVCLASEKIPTRSMHGIAGE